MIQAVKQITDMLNSPLRSIQAKVGLYGPTLLETFSYDGDLKDFTVYRESQGSKFFGCGVCQRISVKLRDKQRKINLEKGQMFQVAIGTENNYIKPFPLFIIENVIRDENTNDIEAIGYDKIYYSSEYTIEDLNLEAPYTIKQFVDKCATLLGLQIKLINVNDNAFNLMCDKPANFETTDSIREALIAVAEATQTIFYIDNTNGLVFKRLNKTAPADLNIDKTNYFTLDRKLPKRLAQIVSATSLGDNIASAKDGDGVIQYVRENPFWVLRSDIPTLLANAMSAVGGITMVEYNCKWRGNFLLEIGDKVAIEDKEGIYLQSYCMSDTITYNGGLTQTSKWEYQENCATNANNPSSLGDALNQTFAKVDKVNKQIDLVVQQSNETKEEVAKLRVDVGSVQTSVESVRRDTELEIDGMTQNVEALSNRVNQTMTSDQVKIEIDKIIDTGIDKVRTGTGYTFDQDGLTIAKSGREMTTQITEDGMRVYKDGLEVLTANNIGVDAKNLHATTYLIIGQNSRFEDYANGSRTGCFWIG